jgi:hypothetical protein
MPVEALPPSTRQMIMTAPERALCPMGDCAEAQLQRGLLDACLAKQVGP